MESKKTINVNGTNLTVESSLDTPLLYVLSDELGLKGPRFGCGLAQCGSCSILVDGVEMRSCVTPLAAITNQQITTLEGLPLHYAVTHNLETMPEMTPLQECIIEEQAIQCGYCYNGMMIKATELLTNNAAPNDDDIRNAMDGHLCRCGTYPKLLSAIKNAATKINEGGEA